MYLCGYNCNNKTVEGYCKTTTCINPMNWAQGTSASGVITDLVYPGVQIVEQVDISDESIKKIVEAFKEQAPLILPREKTCRWIKEPQGYYCSECGDAWDGSYTYVIQSFNYCPNCGLKVENKNEIN